MKNCSPYRYGIFLLIIILALSTLLTPIGIGAAQEADDGDEPGQSAGEGVSPDGALGVEPALSPNRAFSGGPQYDSGWVSINPDQAKTLTHNLGGNPDNYVVDTQYWVNDGNGVNLRYYGGADFGASPAPGHSENDRVGAYWRSLDDTTITVYRRPEDTYAQKVRIRIWVDLFPNYDSGWVNISTSSAITLNHNLGGNPNDYVVDMQYNSLGSGVNQRYFGGADFGDQIEIGSPEDRMSAYWRSLNATSIVVYRRPQDVYASQVRIRIWVRPRATYDSGWVAINQDQAQVLNHNIGGDPGDYVVDMQYRAPDINGVNIRYYGGADFGTNPAPGHLEDDRVGAYWRSLNANSITVYRRPEDDYAPQVRIRIFRFWEPTPSDYDSGWVNMTTDSAQTLDHNLGGDPTSYVVDMTYRMPDSNGINHRYYGGSDFGGAIDIGSPDDRVGAYWRSLNATSITVYRRPEDIYAPQVRVRIWRMPKPDYDSGWIAKAPGEAATTLTHNLGGNYQGDYYVYFDYRNAGDGMNQRYYGGADFGALAFGGGYENIRTGAYWRSLDTDSISIYRRPNDIYAEELRVRIWRIAAPDYDSNWFFISADQSMELDHSLGNDPGAYFLQMYQWDTVDNGLNQRHYGGADLGSLPPTGYAEDDRVGAYWRSLDSSSITVYRRPEDGFSDYVRIRIWDLTQNIYLPLTIKN
jgi:hypothetical protein